MSRTALEDTKYELIKAHVLDPDNSPLSAEKQEMLDRVISATKCLIKILFKNRQLHSINKNTRI